MNTYALPKETFTILHFSDVDVGDFKDLLNLLNNKFIIVEDNPLKEFNLGIFYRNIIEDNNLRTNVVNFYYSKYNEETLISKCGKDPLSYPFKWYLSIIIMNYLDKKLPLSNDILKLLEIDQNKKLSNPDMMDAFMDAARRDLFKTNKVLELILSTKTIERSGWVGKNLPIPHKESIAEHMYSMYYIGKLFLPITLDDATYDKERILKMCLIHDLGETITGDIPHPNKKPNDDIIEDLCVKAMCTALMYNGFEEGSDMYDTWNEWVSDITINANLAHDLDVVQLNNQTLSYALEMKGTFSVDELKLWFRRRPESKLALDIFDKIIAGDNEKVQLFKQIKGE